MSQEEILRRSSYGPQSPVVGERGARTRQRIVDVTLGLFAERGFHDTLVDDIAKAAGVSRATLYQYFESKDQIAVGLLEECGSALMRVIRRLGPLGATAEGFDNLHWWLGEWTWVYDKYATMFAQWTHIDAESSETSLREFVSGFVDAYAGRIAQRLAESGFDGIDRVDMAAALLLVVHRFNYFRHSGAAKGLSDDELLDSFAVVVQLALFPDTPAAALVSLGIGSSHARLAEIGGSSACGRASRLERFDGLSERAHRTVRELLDAAGRTFTARSYRRSNIEDIVTEAGVARGTFYKYFRDKLDVLTILGQEARDQLLETADQFSGIHPGPEEPAELRAWLSDFVTLHYRYAGVSQVWVERQVDDATVQSMGLEVAQRTREAAASVLTEVRRSYPLNLDVAVLVLQALLESVPLGITQQSREVSHDEVVETLAAFIERGLLNGTPVGKGRNRSRADSRA